MGYAIRIHNIHFTTFLSSKQNQQSIQLRKNNLKKNKQNRAYRNQQQQNKCRHQQADEASSATPNSPPSNLSGDQQNPSKYFHKTTTPHLSPPPLPTSPANSTVKKFKKKVFKNQILLNLNVSTTKPTKISEKNRDLSVIGGKRSFSRKTSETLQKHWELLKRRFVLCIPRMWAFYWFNKLKDIKLRECKI